MQNMNDVVWGFILDVLSKTTDNVALNILFVTCLFLIIMSVLRHKWHFPEFFIPEFLYLLSVANMVERLPMIHSRIHTALQTTSQIILSSESYLNPFQIVSGITSTKSVDIASYLYFLKEPDAFKAVRPQMLYEHLFQTLEETRRCLCVDVHNVCFGTIGFVLPCVFIGIFGLILILCVHPEYRKRRILLFLIQASILMYLSTRNYGAMLAAMFLWFMEFILSYVVFEDRSFAENVPSEK